MGTSFHRYTRRWRFCFLVASPTHRDLLLCAKHLFFAAMRRSSEPRAQGRAMATSSTLPGGKKHHTAGASRGCTWGKTPHPHASSVASRFPCLVRLPRWSSFVGCELVKSAFSRLALVAAMVAIAAARGSARGGRTKRRHVMEAKMSSTRACSCRIESQDSQGPVNGRVWRH